MFHLTIMGGTDVRLRDDSNFVITLMGGTEILMPTLAEKILTLKETRAEWGPDLASPIRRTTIITIMGGTGLKYPTIAREIESMMELRQSGALSDAEIFRLWQEVVRLSDIDAMDTFTLMGGTGEEMPSLKDELRDLERIAAKGLLTLQEFHDIHHALSGELPSESRASFLQQKIRALLSPAARPNQYTTNPVKDRDRLTSR